MAGQGSEYSTIRKLLNLSPTVTYGFSKIEREENRANLKDYIERVRIWRQEYGSTSKSVYFDASKLLSAYLVLPISWSGELEKSSLPPSNNVRVISLQVFSETGVFKDNCLARSKP
jgi:hypothetical protein